MAPFGIKINGGGGGVEHLWHLVIKITLDYRPKKLKKCSIICGSFGIKITVDYWPHKVGKSHLISGQKSGGNALYYRSVLRKKSIFERQGGRGS